MYHKSINEIARQVAAASDKVALNTPSTNLTRQKNNTYASIDISHLNQVVSIDPANKLITVEPRITMEELVKATLPYNLIPETVPEFRTITAGGAFNGIGIESSAHARGLFHDGVTQVELVRGNGEIVVASGKDPLFNALPGAFGTLGIVTKLTLRLVQAKPWVHLNFSRFKTIEEALQALSDLTGQCDFLDGLSFGPHDYLVMHGSMADSPQNLPKYRGKHRWFYAYAKKARTKVAIPLTEYLFRYDRCAFWMGHFALTPAALFHKVPKTRSPRCPWPITQRAFSWALSSKRLYAKLHRIPEEIMRDNFVVQDCVVPITEAAKFMADLDIYPLWLCPVKGAPSHQILSPNALSAPLCLNIGIYGVDKGVAPEATRHLEQRLIASGGRKGLYAHNTLTEDEFWTMHDKAAYDALHTPPSLQSPKRSSHDPIPRPHGCWQTACRGPHILHRRHRHWTTSRWGRRRRSSCQTPQPPPRHHLSA